MQIVLQWISQVSLQFWRTLQTHLHINLLDLIIVVTILFYAHEGYMLGFALASIDLASFVLAFIIALKFYASVAHLVTAYLSLPIGFSNAISFFLLACICEIIFSLLLHRLLRLLPQVYRTKPLYKLFRKADHWLGVLPGLLSAFIILSFILTVIVSLPSSPFIKQLVNGSRIGSDLIANTSFLDDRLNNIFGGALTDTLNFMTVEPQSDALVNLHFKVTNGTIDSQAEQEMFNLVNTQRVRYGLVSLVLDARLSQIARAHSQDMFSRGYFSHYTPEGLSPFDRMARAGITYQYAGENLALAPSTQLAMQGLMNSPGHRANILDPNYQKIGIGAIDGGIYGIMFTQDFTN